MRVFVTGATGFIGSAVVQELIGAGHQVLGLARSEKAAEALTTAGAQVHYGDLEDLESLRSGAAASDSVIHTGFVHDFLRFKEVCEIDRHAIEALGSALIGTDRPLIITSGIGILTPLGRPAVENDLIGASVNPRTASEEAADSLSARGVRVAVVRLPPSVHGKGDHGFVPILINIAKEKGLSVFRDEGLNRWSAVHLFDAARLFRLVLENTFITGARYHGVAEEGIAFREIAEAIGKLLGVPVSSKSRQEADAHFSWFAHFAALDCPASARLTQEELGWVPVEPGLILELESTIYLPSMNGIV